MTKLKPGLILMISATILTVTVATMLTVGSADVPLAAVTAVMLKRLFGIDSGAATAAQQIIVWNIRWQRVALAVVVGGGLAVAGACFQTLFKNPLAEPYVLGVSSGAALGAAVAIVTHYTHLTMVFAFIGAILSLSLVYLFSQRSLHIRSDQQLLLAGIACGALLQALLSAIMAVNSQQMHIIVFWLMGSLTNYVESLKIVFAVVSACLTLAMAYARDLDVMALGDENAKFLGVDVSRVKIILLVSTTLMTGICVSVSGIIGFVGLIVPHMVRKVAGAGHLLLLPLSAMWGAMFLLVADGLTRVVPAMSLLPVGVVTALFGSPFFLYLLRSAGMRRQ